MSIESELFSNIPAWGMIRWYEEKGRSFKMYNLTRTCYMGYPAPLMLS